jgi:aconitase A
MHNTIYYDEIHLSDPQPLIALPSSPGNVVAVREVVGRPIYQAYIGSSANPGVRDFAIAALIVGGRQVPSQVSLDINPTSRQILENLINFGILPLTFENPDDWDRIAQGDILVIQDVRQTIQAGTRLTVVNETENEEYKVVQRMSERQLQMVLQGSLINVVRNNAT